MTIENKTSEAQRKANEKWKEENREKQKVYTLRSQCKRFINEFAKEKDLKDIEKLIEERRKNLKNI